MTDKEKFLALMGEFGVVVTEEPSASTPRTIVSITSGDGEKNIGYSGFYADFSFSPEGKFLNVGVWE